MVRSPLDRRPIGSSHWLVVRRARFRCQCGGDRVRRWSATSLRNAITSASSLVIGSVTRPRSTLAWTSHRRGASTGLTSGPEHQPRLDGGAVAWFYDVSISIGSTLCEKGDLK